MTKLRLVMLALALLTASAYAQLDNLEFEASNSLRFDDGSEIDVRRLDREHPDNTVARHFVENMLRLDLYGSGFRFGGRLLYFKPSEADTVQYGLENESRFDKRYFEAQLAPFDIRVGDFSDLWGYGLALSLFENRDLYFDSELDGIHTKASLGPISLTGLSGETDDGFLVKKTHVTAGRIQVGSGSKVAFNYVRNDSSFYNESNTASIDWNLSRGPVSFYGEHAWKDTELSTRTSFGKAMFYGLTLAIKNWSLLLEYNNYDYGLASAIQNPPATYREVGPRLLQGREPHFLNIPDEVGYQVELSGSVTDEIYALLHYNLASHHAHDQDGIPRPTLQQEDNPFWEMYGNAEWYMPGGQVAYLELGANEEAAVVWQERMWAHAKYSTPFKGDQELAFEVEQLMMTEFRGDEELDFHDQLYSVGWIPTGSFSVYLIYSLTNDDELKAEEGDNWPSIESAISFGGGKHRAILFYGRERGGLKCSNGVCREVQAFEGVRFSLESSL